MEAKDIKDSTCFITDREIALINSLDNTFPNLAHILCTWHVNINVLANC
jgi:hypothetical protein